MDVFIQCARGDQTGGLLCLPPLLLQALLPGVRGLLRATQQQVLDHKEHQVQLHTQEHLQQQAAIPDIAAAARTEVSGVALARALQLPVGLVKRSLDCNETCSGQSSSPLGQKSRHMLSKSSVVQDGAAHTPSHTGSSGSLGWSPGSGTGVWVGSVLGGLGEEILLPEPLWVQRGACPASWLQQLVVQVAAGVQAEMVKALESCGHMRVRLGAGSKCL
jgi:hypothetical protein